MTESLLLLALSIIVALGLVLVTAGLRDGRKLNLPPALPLGRPAQKPWLYFTAEAHRGELTSFTKGSHVTVVINTAEAAQALLEQRSAIYSSRPPFHVLSMARKGALGGWMQYGETHRKWRKLVQNALNGRSAENYKRWQAAESAILMQRVLHDPEDWLKHVNEFATVVATLIGYGYRPKDIHTDSVLKKNAEAEHREIKFATNQTIVERWPALRFAPSFLIPILGEARYALANDAPFFVKLFEDAAKTSGSWSFSHFVHEQPLGSYGLSLEQLGYAAALPMSTGIETTTGEIKVFLLACAAFGSKFLPRAHKEIDTVVGKNRLPAFDDLDQLPYLRAVLKEVLRWGCIVPMLLPHATTRHDVWRGMDIPKGSTVLLNGYAISRDPKYYPEPDRFWPERFLGGQRIEFVVPSGSFAWGAGRRVCPGQAVAENTLLVVMARLIWSFDMVANGPVDLSQDNWSDQGIVTVPLKIPLGFQVRSEKHRQLIEEERNSALVELEQAQTS